MNAVKIGNVIKILRSKEGYTQQELADCLEVTDKAVSKWERGLGVPDISIITKLSILLDIDVDNLLEGNIAYLDESWFGWLRLSGKISASQETYGKPIVYFPICYFILAGIRNITISCNKEDEIYLRKQFGNGEKVGLRLSYKDKSQEHENLMVIDDYHFIYGPNLTKYFQRAMGRRNGVTVMSIPRKKGVDEKRIAFDNHKGILKGKIADYYRLPIAFYPAKWAEKIPDYEALLSESMMFTEPMGNGMLDHEIANFQDAHKVAGLIQFIEETTGNNIYCVPEIALRRGMISKSKLKKRIDEYPENEYLKKICN